MSENFQKKTSGIIVTILIGLIVISFMFSDYTRSGSSSSDEIAVVGDVSIRYREYEMEFNRQLQFFSQITGGQPLTQQQIEQFGLKQQTVNNLINNKLYITLADEIGAIPSVSQIKEEIKGLPYFQNNGQFDVEKYKAILGANRLSPTEFEKEIAQDTKTKITRQLLENFPLSQKYLDEIGTFKKEQVKISGVEIDSQSLEKFIDVSATEITDFLKKEENLNRVKSVFNERKASFDKPEEIKARHILLKVEKDEKAVLEEITKIKNNLNTQNFSKIANEKTQDPTGKGKGGDLGWFSHGKMVPEFDKAAFDLKPGQISEPIKTSFGYHIILVDDKKSSIIAELAQHQNNLSKEIIQKNKKTQLDALVKDVKEKLSSLITKNDFKGAKDLAKKYSLTFTEADVNVLDGAQGQLNLTADQVNKAFAEANNDGKFLSFEDGPRTKILLAKKLDASTAKVDLAQEKSSKASILARKLGQDVIEVLKKTTKIKDYTTKL
jgi:peptidyl-prolyl cis-trans isomerase D